jgi:hypothetical protein
MGQMGKAKSDSGNAIGEAKPQDDAVISFNHSRCSVYKLDAGGLPGQKFRCIRLFFAITVVTEMTRSGDSLLKTGPKFTLV